MPTAAEWAEIRKRSNANKKKGKGRAKKAATPKKKAGRKGHKAISASAARGKIPKVACVKIIPQSGGRGNAIAPASIKWRQATKAGGPKSTWMRMGCPTSDFKSGKCHGLMKMLEVVKGTPKGQGCPTGYKRK